MGRKRLYPPKEQLQAYLDQHPDWSWPQIHTHYSLAGTPLGLRRCAAKDGVLRHPEREGQHLRADYKDGGGPMDTMSDEDFWGKVTTTLEGMRADREARQQHAKRERGMYQTLRRATTKAALTEGDG